MSCQDSPSKNRMPNDFFLQILLQFKGDAPENLVKNSLQPFTTLCGHCPEVIQNFVPIEIKLLGESCNSYMVIGHDCCPFFGYV